MKVGLLVIAFNVDQWLYEMLSNVENHVDMVFIAHPVRPWRYRESERQNRSNPTILDKERLDSYDFEYKIVRGDWEYDEDTRNAIRVLAKKEECDWLVVQDADEFYNDDGWKDLRELMVRYKGKEVALTSRWMNFWKSVDYLIVNRDGSILSDNECAALSLAGNAYFTYSRSVSCEIIRSNAICYHLGYVMSDIEARTKVETWTHTADVDINGWYSYKWKNWGVATKYLHPGNPPVWDRAIKTPASIRIPVECESFRQELMRDVSYRNSNNIFRGAAELVYDFSALIIFYYKRFKGRVSRWVAKACS